MFILVSCTVVGASNSPFNTYILGGDDYEIEGFIFVGYEDRGGGNHNIYLMNQASPVCIVCPIIRTQAILSAPHSNIGWDAAFIRAPFINELLHPSSAIVVGITNSLTSGIRYNGFILKVYGDLSLVWSYAYDTYYGESSVVFTNIANSAASGNKYFVSGSICDDVLTSCSPILLAIDSTGEIIFARRLNMESIWNQVGIAIDIEDKILLATIRSELSAIPSIVVAKFSPYGSLMNAKYIYINNVNNISDISVDYMKDQFYVLLYTSYTNIDTCATFTLLDTLLAHIITRRVCSSRGNLYSYDITSNNNGFVASGKLKYLSNTHPVYYEMHDGVINAKILDSLKGEFRNVKKNNVSVSLKGYIEYLSLTKPFVDKPTYDTCFVTNLTIHEDTLSVTFCR
ncbi:MAG: hypothetical protein GXO39_05715 [Thermotogae bacterium]|nr:hypothetical protein [Thermotogota bacterium]